ncbi:MAG: adventurous gliding motility lipoprotein CglB [Myxococcaceae bacterium]
MRSLLLTAALVLAGCQTYDFEPVQPLAIGQTTQSKKIVAHRLKPNLMMLLDKSGSMQTNTSTQAPCPATIGGCGPGNTCPNGCPTRISDMKNAMSTLLSTGGTIVRYGVSAFPVSATASCSPTDASQVLVQLLGPALSDDDTQLQAQADAVNMAIQDPVKVAPGGGTPTADSLRFVGNLSELQDGDRDNFVLLLTDGVPNCNQNNPNSCTSQTASLCQCTTGTCTTASGLCSLGCLDADNSVQAVAELYNKKIRTIVIGFGADTAQAAAFSTLNQMAIAGNFARACPMGTDAECGAGDTCNTANGLNVCNQAFFQAANQADLFDALKKISDVLGGGSICEYTLDNVPSDPRYLSVTVDGQALQRCNASMGCNTWTYSQMGLAKVTFEGTTCDKVKAATAQNPVDVQFRIVTSL